MASRLALDMHEEELILLTFSHLSIDALTACAATCHVWHRLAKETVQRWALAPDARSAAVLCTATSKSGALAALLGLVASLDFRPNLGIITISCAFSAKARDEIVAAVGDALPPRLVLAGASCTGALGPSAPGAREPIERESGYSISLHLQWLPDSSIHFFLLPPDDGRPVDDRAPATRSTRAGPRTEGRRESFNAWMYETMCATPRVQYSSLLAFTVSLDDDDDGASDSAHESGGESTQKLGLLDLFEGFSLPVCGGQASGKAPRIFAYCGRKGGLLSAAGRADAVIVCIHSQTFSLRACAVCEEWGAGAKAQAAAMGAFARDAPCAHNAHKLLASGPPLERPHAALIVSCVGRGAGDARALASQWVPGEGSAPSMTVTGFFSLGEIGPSGNAFLTAAHQYACVVALFGRAKAETAAERDARISSRCGFRACVCERADPWDESYMLHVANPWHEEP